jgi:hypothetical protein
MKHGLALAAAAALVAGYGALAACSSTDPPGGSTDSGVVDGAPPRDGATGSDAEAGPGEVDAGPRLAGRCSAINGPACDIVLQDCPAAAGKAQECSVVAVGDGGFTTGCTPTTPSEHLMKGHACCPALAATGQNPCLPGLECSGDPRASCDGGALPGRCAPRCCPGDGNDDAVCGAADPEGFAGHCGLPVDLGGARDVYDLCAYEAVCRPFHLKPCPPGAACVVKDAVGTASCVASYTVDGGPPPGEGQRCIVGRACADGLVCVAATGGVDGGGSGDGGGEPSATCRMMCLTPDTATPFDAGALDGTPTNGGCSGGKKCTGTVLDGNRRSVFPPWISICE